MKFFAVFLFSISAFLSIGQSEINYQKPPVFENCKEKSFDQLQDCFRFELHQFIFQNFKIPSIVNEKNYQGDIKILFEVNQEGKFNIIYIDAAVEELKTATIDVFSKFPVISPATYDGKPIDIQYSTKINIPLIDPSISNTEKTIVERKQPKPKDESLNAVMSNEFDSISNSLVPYDKKEFQSQLNIPFTHNYYVRFDRQMNVIGTNSHTASKPFLYSDVTPYYDFKAEKVSLSKDSKSWIGRKLWDEHLVEVQGKNYWFTIDPILDVQVGRDSEAQETTYNNTRGVFIQAGLGKNLNFSTSFYESQGRFAQYFNEYAESLKAFGPDPAIIPGRGIAKRFKDDAYDYPLAEAYLSYTPAKFLNIQFGHGKNFIGDGYRSLFLSDVASPSPFLKTNFKFWKIKYTSTWLWLKDVRDQVVIDKAFLPKYMANHFLSWNVSKRLNLGFFESVIWDNSNGRGFDANYLNPLIFLRAIEFSTGQGAGNAIIGLSGKYKWNNKVNLYGQFIIDEFSLSDVRASNKSWKNKFGFQLGAKYFNAFNIDGLMLQAEYNQVRPYTYSHNTIVLNYAHNNQSMAHLWGNNFRELVLIGRYNYKRWFADAKLIFGERGFDFRDGTDNFYYGGDIFGNENDRPFDTGIEIGQGNNTSVFHGELMAGYIINPMSNLRAFLNVNYRNFDPTVETAITNRTNTTWISVGLRTDLFNWYNDF